MIRPEIQSLVTPITQLKPHPKNVRQGDIGAISLSLEQHGQYRPIVVQQSTGFILAGNHTYKAAKALKWKDIAATYVDVDDEQALRILLIDNRANDLASYDDSALVEMLKALMDTELKLDGTGFDPSDLDQLLKDLEMETGNSIEGDPDAVPDNAPSKTVLGDVWILGSHRLMCGNSTIPTDLDKLMKQEKIVSIVTDPPYGMNFQSNHRKVKHKQIANDETEDALQWAISLNAEHSKYIFCRWDNLVNVTKPNSFITWVKNNWSMGDLEHEHARQTETILFYSGVNHKWPAKRPTDVIEAARTNNALHPTQKPVDLIKEIIDWTEGIVLDLFGGSGTTLIAAHQTGRTAYLMELDPHYCDVICKRFQQATGITPIAEATGNEHSFIE